MKEWIHVILMNVFLALSSLRSLFPGLFCFQSCSLVHGCQIQWLKRLYGCKHLFISHPPVPALSFLRVTQCLIFIDSVFIKTMTLSPLFSVGWNLCGCAFLPADRKPHSRASTEKNGASLAKQLLQVLLFKLRVKDSTMESCNITVNRLSVLMVVRLKRPERNNSTSTQPKQTEISSAYRSCTRMSRAQAVVK